MSGKPIALAAGQRLNGTTGGNYSVHAGPEVWAERRIKLSRDQSSKGQTKPALFVGLTFGFVPIPFPFPTPFLISDIQ